MFSLRFYFVSLNVFLLRRSRCCLRYSVLPDHGSALIQNASKRFPRGAKPVWTLPQSLADEHLLPHLACGDMLCTLPPPSLSPLLPPLQHRSSHEHKAPQRMQVARSGARTRASSNKSTSARLAADYLALLRRTRELIDTYASLAEGAIPGISHGSACTGASDASASCICLRVVMV